MRRPSSERLCLATVTDLRYLPGTVVLLDSFLRHNPWFGGEIVVITDGMPERGWRRLAHLPRIRRHPVGHQLKRRLAELVSRHPGMAPRLPRFLSLEAFGLEGFDRVLYLDSDVLCTGDAAGLLSVDGALVCCPDQSWWRGQVRDPRSFSGRNAPGDGGAAAELPRATFNAGVMAINPEALGPSVFEAILERVRPETWDHVLTGHTDQVVLNHHFGRTWVAAPERYNYLVSRDTDGWVRARSSADEAVFLHFIGHPKPWRRRSVPRGTLDPASRAAFSLWERAETRQALGLLATRGDPLPLADLLGRRARAAAVRTRRRLLTRARHRT